MADRSIVQGRCGGCVTRGLGGSVHDGFASVAVPQPLPQGLPLGADPATAHGRATRSARERRSRFEESAAISVRRTRSRPLRLSCRHRTLARTLRRVAISRRRVRRFWLAARVRRNRHWRWPRRGRSIGRCRCSRLACRARARWLGKSSRRWMRWATAIGRARSGLSRRPSRIRSEGLDLRPSERRGCDGVRGLPRGRTSGNW